VFSWASRDRSICIQFGYSSTLHARIRRLGPNHSLAETATAELSLTGLTELGETERFSWLDGGEEACGILMVISILIHGDDASRHTFLGWGWPSQHFPVALHLPLTVHSPLNRNICDPGHSHVRFSHVNNDATKSHLLHLSEYVFMRRQLSVKAEELLLLFRHCLAQHMHGQSSVMPHCGSRRAHAHVDLLEFSR
jgi:hypothetical protein